VWGMGAEELNEEEEELDDNVVLKKRQQHKLNEGNGQVYMEFYIFCLRSRILDFTRTSHSRVLTTFTRILSNRPEGPFYFLTKF
jgi:hypothetical protein